MSTQPGPLPRTLAEASESVYPRLRWTLLAMVSIAFIINFLDRLFCFLLGMAVFQLLRTVYL
jgi:hypothetical protein